ncbi:MAG: hypothetical protein SWX82_19270 [Cyanobacteriota bacterium]|nr:hypothetical protein [Cyanobacteriota bacterium]
MPNDSLINHTNIKSIFPVETLTPIFKIAQKIVRKKVAIACSIYANINRIFGVGIYPSNC